jgi:hypothetical protein
MPSDDQHVRLAAFAFLAEQTQLHGEVLPRDILAAGFQFDGHPVPLIGPKGIFKLALLELPLSITTVQPLKARHGRVRTSSIQPAYCAIVMWQSNAA